MRAARRVLRCDGDLQPTPMSILYRIRVTYRLQKDPEVHVVQPALRDRSSKDRIPHVYPGNRLCLFLTGVGEWRPTDSTRHSNSVDCRVAVFLRSVVGNG